MAAPIRLMFLGNRRIAWEVLKLIGAESRKGQFDTRALVTDKECAHHYQRLNPTSSAVCLPSEIRQSEQIREVVHSEAIDVLLSIQYNWIIPDDIFDLVERRAFNLHNARLPDYRGYNSITHAIANGDAEYATTIHWMHKVVDTGPIAYAENTPIGPDDTALSLYVRTVDAAIRAANRLLDDLAAGRQPPSVPIDARQGKFYGRDSVARLSDLTGETTPEKIARIARAAFFPPYNTAYFLHDAKKYLVLPEGDASRMLKGALPANQPLF